MREITQEEFADEISGKNALVIFGGAGCVNCRMQYAIIDQIAAELTDRKIAVLKLDVAKATDLVSQYNVQSMPTMLVVSNGSVVETLVGLKPKPVLLNKLSVIG